MKSASNLDGMTSCTIIYNNYVCLSNKKNILFSCSLCMYGIVSEGVCMVDTKTGNLS